MEKIKCPQCDLHMKKLTHKDITIDVCKKCHGMWLQKGEMEKLIKLERTQQPWWKFW